jgi:hypothetical protein
MKIPATIGQPPAARYASSYKSNTALAANTPETVFTPAANTLGAWVWTANFVHYLTAPGSAFVAKTSAPTTVIDGDVILSSDTMAYNASYYESGSLKTPIFIPAGKGLYFINTAVAAAAMRSVLYTLLT